MRKTREEKAITLIALIITIVVLLILAVVAMNAVTGDGIIQHATNAKRQYSDAQYKEQGMLSQYEIILSKNTPKKISEVIEQELEENTFVVDERGKIFVVPKGYKIVKDATTNNKALVDEGVVIQHVTEGSQFVWVPITKPITAYGLGTENSREPDIVPKIKNNENVLVDGSDKDPENLKIAGCIDWDKDTDIDENDFKMQLTNEFNKMADSVNRYGGFYVGRYEVSFNSKRNAQSKSGIAPANAKASSSNNWAGSWYGLYSLCKTYMTTSVESSMIWGSQYKEMLRWMGDAAKTANENYNNTLTTGYEVGDVINNIYDLAGCSFEWTLTAYQLDARIMRGGRGLINSSGFTANRSSYASPNTYGAYYSSRLALYII